MTGLRVQHFWSRRQHDATQESRSLIAAFCWAPLFELVAEGVEEAEVEEVEAIELLRML